MSASPAAATNNPKGKAPVIMPEPPASWLRQLARIVVFVDKKKIQPQMALRNTAGVLLPLIAGYALGMPRGGLAMASGALNVAYSDGSDPYGQRAKRMLLAGVLCSIAVLLGALTGHYNVASIALVTVWAFAAGMLVAVGTTAADLGVISTVMLVVYGGQPLTPWQAAGSALLAMAGALLQTGLSVALWPVQRYQPEKRALGTLFAALARAARTPSQAANAPAATAESLQAQNALAGLSSSGNLEAVRYRSLLTQAERIRLALTALARLRMRLSREGGSEAAVETLDRYLKNAADVLEELGGTLEQNREPSAAQDRLVLSVALAYQLRDDNAGEPGTFASATAQNARHQMDTLSGQLRATMDLASRTTPEGEAAFAKEEARQPLWLRFSGRLATIRGNLNFRSAAFRHAVRLAACMAVGDAVGRIFESERSYWIPMTIILVLKPEFTTTFSRGILRIAGTIAGLLVATALFHYLPIHTATQVVLIGVFMFLMRWVGPANYGVFAVSLSALIVLLLTITGISPKEVIQARGLNTVVGGVLALAAYAAWPTWEKAQIAEVFATLLEAYKKSFHEISQGYVQPEGADAKERDHARRAARTARSNLEASLDRLSAEPGITSDQVGQWSGMLASSHRFAHAMMALEAALPQRQGAPPKEEFRRFRDDVERTLDLVAVMLRGERVAKREFPDLREDHNRLLAAEGGGSARYQLVNVEADRLTNSLNSLREQAILRLRPRAGREEARHGAAGIVSSGRTRPEADR
jgi:uncharacterized membrane protein YccC